jgi:flagellar basal body-associated protein FliL
MSGFFDTEGLREAYAKRREPESLRTLADSYWIIIIVLATLSFVAGASYGIWQMLTPPQDGEAPQPAVFIGFSREELGAVVKALEERQQRFFEGVEE